MVMKSEQSIKDVMDLLNQIMNTQNPSSATWDVLKHYKYALEWMLKDDEK